MKQKSRVNPVMNALRGSTRTAKLGMVILVIWLLSAIMAPLISPYGPNEINIMKRFKPPIWNEKGSSEHILGTDEMGRDVLSRLIYGSQISLLVGVSSVIIGMLIGVALGLLAGYLGGIADTIIMRTVDVMLSFPFIFMALVLMAVLGSSLINVIVVLGLTSWVPYARTIRAQVLSTREQEYITAAGTIGCTEPRIVFRHILPNVVDSAIILGTLEMGIAILAEAALTFLGMGVPPSIPTWGGMIATGREYIYTAGYLTTIPGIAIFLVCLSINFVGDWIRDARDPRLRGVAKG